ncbi:uncharacterized protein LOC103145640 [Poecilia formosa]|uniref:uncharacterized protein LOC103145640 n=1 Tax=Poecilia formosa TaxID=48698 RepID=UPI0004443239|nr:PREDICTED: uncharacterized protein LOC103145640 [Poecilia formosa]XP_007563231.1 PREDICTED: uncharacterized protein LOC103145640 [Poecilia formosa]XP_007563239.1 PREDICTED: uncharacterized protein LOC103145640 [Poecilia formosa]
MPLFRALDEQAEAKARPRRRGLRNTKGTKSCWRTRDDDPVLSLTRLCLLSLADNMKDLWVKDYADNYLDHYSFRYIMGPFNLLPGELVEELTWLLSSRKQLSRAALHLLLVPHLQGLSLERCPGLVNPALCAHIAARCQGLRSLDLSGAQQLPPKALCETMSSLPALRSLSLAGMPCDRSVIQTVARHCLLLQHLDVSRCHLLSPAALLALGGVVSSSSSASSSSTSSPLPLSSLLALDIGFGEQEGDSTVAAAYLLLSLPCLKRLALEGLGPACRLIEQREFSQADEFADREGVSSLHQVWRERMLGQSSERWMMMRGEESTDNGEVESPLLEEDGCDAEEDLIKNLWPFCLQIQTEDRMKNLSQSGLILQLKDVKGVTCESLGSLGNLCPGLNSLSMNIGKQGPLLTADLQTWSGQLRSLSFIYSGPVADLLPALQVAGCSLISLTLEGVKTRADTPLLELIRVCPRLRDLLVSAEPPATPQYETIDNQLDDQDLPKLPNLRSLKISFSYEHNQMKPLMSWMSLKEVIRCLLIGSPLLENLSLISLPCPLNCIIQDTLHSVNPDVNPDADSSGLPPLPLGRIEHIDLLRTDVQMSTVKSLMQLSKRLKYVDVSYCWRISQREWLDCKKFRQVEVVWV